jgi:hypothetical protein
MLLGETVSFGEKVCLVETSNKIIPVAWLLPRLGSSEASRQEHSWPAYLLLSK